MNTRKLRIILCTVLTAVTLLTGGEVRAADLPQTTIGPDRQWDQTGGSDFYITVWPDKNEIKVKVQIVYRDRSGALIPVPDIRVAMSDILEDGRYGPPFDGDSLYTDSDGMTGFTIKDYPKDYMVHVGRKDAYPGGAFQRQFLQDGQVEQIILYEEQDVTPAPTAAPTEAPRVTATPCPTESPEVTATPRPTKSPEVTATPRPTERPRTTATPRPTERPQATATPRPTKAPRVTATPRPTKAPRATATPHPTETPGTTTLPAATESPAPTPDPQYSMTPAPTPSVSPGDAEAIATVRDTGSEVCPAFHWTELLLMLLLLIYTILRLRRIRRHMKNITNTGGQTENKETYDD